MRWIPAMQQWGCDVCKVMYPAQPVQAPMAMAMQPKKSHTLAIVVSVLAIGGAAAAITLIAMNQKSGSATPTTEVAGSGSGSPSDIAPISQKPIAIPSTPPPPAKNVTVGKPEQMDLADLWGYPRSDGGYLVSAPSFEAAFPHKPTAKVEPYANNKTLDVYTLGDDLAGRGLLQLQIVALGHGGRDPGLLDGVKGLVAKVGAVTESHRTDGGLDVTRYEATSAATGETARVDTRADMSRGLLFVATTSFIKSDQPAAEAFLASVHARPTPDVDPKALSIRVRKEHGKNQAHDATDAFTIELPWTTKVSRTVPGVQVASSKGKASVVIEIEELAPPDALAFSPTAQKAALDKLAADLEKTAKHDVKIATEKLGGLPASRLDAKGNGHSYHTHFVWNRYQHRRYTVACVDAPCDIVALSLKFAAPPPTP
jgi:hypothetical protein